MIRHNKINNMSLSVDNLKRGCEIFGQCVQCQLRKDNKRKQVYIPQVITTNVGEIISVDFFFLGGNNSSINTYMISYDHFSGHIVVIPLSSKTTNNTEIAISRLIDIYAREGHVIRWIIADRERVFSSLSILLEAKHIHLELTSPGRHCVNAERAIRLLKERCRATINGLPCKLPSQL